MQLVLNNQIRWRMYAIARAAEKHRGVTVSDNLGKLVNGGDQQRRTFPINILIYCPYWKKRQLQKRTGGVNAPRRCAHSTGVDGPLKRLCTGCAVLQLPVIRLP